MPDTVSMPRASMEKILYALEEYVGDFSCDHSIGLCFCTERELIKEIKTALEHAGVRYHHIDV